MQTFSCPIPDNINPLGSNGFMFSIVKYPEISFFCQEVTIPGLNLPAIPMSTRLSDFYLSGSKLEFEELSIQFLIDENMNNFVSIYNWLVGLGAPESKSQYVEFINNSHGFDYTRNSKESSDGILQILNSANKPIRRIHFHNIIPISLQSLTVQSTTTDTTYLLGQATFRYDIYKLE